jgi:hypothetical protein
VAHAVISEYSTASSIDELDFVEIESRKLQHLNVRIDERVYRQKVFGGSSWSSCEQ